MPRKKPTSTTPDLSEALARQVRLHESSTALLQEHLAELELALEDSGWRKLSIEGDRDFSREGLKRIMATSRLMFLKNPLINRAITLQALYVWAQGCTIASEDEAIQTEIDAFLSDPMNQQVLTSHQARTLAEIDLQVYGNLFFALFAGGPKGGAQVRCIPAEEIEEIICDPEDSAQVWFYKRTWNQQRLNLETGITTPETRHAYYPDIRYLDTAPEQRPVIGSVMPVMWDAPVYHVRVGGLSGMRFGVPESYQAHDWARAYNEFLGNWATIVKAYARFAWSINTGGGVKGVAALKNRLGASDGGGATVNSNPPVNTASTFISSNAELSPLKTAGATTAAKDGMYLALMVSAATGTPYPMLMGDPSTGNLATAKTLDRPTELKYRDRQELWKSILITILEYAIVRSKKAAGGRLRPYGDDHKSPITVSFPSILEHDISESIKAVISAATLDGKTLAGTIPRDQVARMVLTALGVPNVDEIVKMLEDEEPVDPVEPQVAEALRGLREAIDEWRRAA